jgi:xylulokinase
VIGGGDVRSTLIGANAFDSQRACLYLGTAAWIAVPCSGDTHNFLGATATTGAALKWLLALLEGDGEGDGPRQSYGRSYAALVQEAESVPAGARGLIFLPHLMGERGPRYNPEAKGVLFGLTLAHGRGEIARAVLEGCAFQIGWILENSGCVVREVIAVGGGAKSALWLSIIADVTGTTLLTPWVLEAGALGAAIFAGVGVGIFRDVQDAAKELVYIAERIEHDRTRHKFYGSVYPMFVELEDKVASLYGKVPI